MAILAHDGVEATLEVRAALVELDVEPEVHFATRTGRKATGRSAGDQVAAARDEAGANRLRNRYYGVFGRVVVGVVPGTVVTHDDADRVLRGPGCRVDGKGNALDGGA